MDYRIEHLLDKEDHPAGIVHATASAEQQFIRDQVLQSSRIIKGGLALVALIVYLICKSTSLADGLKGMNPAPDGRCVVDKGLDATLGLTLVVWSDPQVRWALKVLSSFMIDATFIAVISYV
jgi:hypothetical protein